MAPLLRVSKEKPLSNMVFTATGMSFEEGFNEREYVQKITDLGGFYSENFTGTTKYLILFNTHSSHKYSHAIKKCPDVVLLRKSFVINVYNKWIKAENIDIEAELRNGMILPFTNKNIYISHLNTLPSSIVDDICQGGGQYSERFCDEVNVYVWSGDYESYIDFMKNDGRTLSRPVVHKNWLIHSIQSFALLPVSEYRIRGHDTPKNNLRTFNPNASLLPKNYYNGQKSAITLQKSTTVPKRKQMGEQWDGLLNTAHAATKKRRIKTDPQWENDQAGNSYETSIENYELPENSEEKSVINDERQSYYKAIFENSIFYLHGFGEKKLPVLKKVIESNGGTISLDINQHQLTHLILYSNLPLEDRPDLSKLDESVLIGTEWLIERSLDKKVLVYDHWCHYIKYRNLSDFENIGISISGFSGTELLHIERLIGILGANYCQKFNSKVDLLIAEPGSTKEEYAKRWKIPIVSSDWLWKSAQMGKAASPVIKRKSVPK